MKLQNLAIIFVAIVLPLTLILSAYTSRQIDTLTLQQQYDAKLMSSTYDGIKAFEINATYNDLSNVSDTLREDVEAAISTFMGSLATSLGASGYKEDNIKPYIPAILFTLYDGYYIYAPTRVAGPGGELSDTYEYMLKPYNYYTVRYKDPNNSNNDVVINYTLDNYIVVYGWIDGEGYVVKSGYLVTNEQTVNDEKTLMVNVPFKARGDSSAPIEIGKRTISDEKYSPDYLDTHAEDRYDFLYPRNEVFYVAHDSASQYYKESVTFTEWVTKNLGWVRADMAMRNNEYLSETDDWFEGNTYVVFDIGDNNDPEDELSAFSDHKTNVIRNSIQNNLNEAITSYSQNSGMSFDFRLPNLKTEEWDMVSSNICMLTFLQGLPVGTKYYNNYSLVTSTTNKLYVSKDNLYFTTDGDEYYHKIGCEHLGEDDTLVGFTAFDYELKRVKTNSTTNSTDTASYEYYYKHMNGDTPKMACYYCIVSTNNVVTDVRQLRSDAKKKAFYTAMAREKQSRYATTSYFGTEE